MNNLKREVVASESHFGGEQDPGAGPESQA